MHNMSFRADMRRFMIHCDSNLAAITVGSVELAQRSIQYGSDLTGSPGQPEQSGDLIVSWTIEAIDARRARIYTMSPYAESNEDGIARPGGGPYVLRSARGGRWSVRKTRIGFYKIVDYVASTLAAGRTKR
jgi:hypothetical protein